jgi:hypothetical protein
MSEQINGQGGHTPPCKPIILVDFDGVIHSYTSGWQGVTTITDPPVDGAIEWLNEMIESDIFQVSIFSTRNFQEGGVGTMIDYLLENGLTTDNLLKLTFPTEKTGAFLIIDDRAMTFEGVFPTQCDILNFKPWYKK